MSFFVSLLFTSAEQDGKITSLKFYWSENEITMVQTVENEMFHCCGTASRALKIAVQERQERKWILIARCTAVCMESKLQPNLTFPLHPRFEVFYRN